MVDKLLFNIVVILMMIGLVFSYSLPLYLETTKGWSEWHFFIRFFIFSGIGIIIMLVLSQCNPDKCLSKIGWGILAISSIVILLMPTVLLKPYCPSIKGAHRWINLGSVSISPVEFFKIGIIYFFAWGFSRKLTLQNVTLKKELKLLLPYLIVFAFTAGYIILFLNDLGQVILIGSIFIMMLTFTTASYRVYMVIIGLLTIIFIFGLSLGGYRVQRVRASLYSIYSALPESIQNFLGLEISGNDISYQIKQSINAIYNGGVWGKGIGSGEFKLGYLSDIHTDFVLSGITEEIGFVGVSLVITFFIALIWRILKIANRIENTNTQAYIYKLFCVGVAILIGLELTFNMMGIIGFFPLKGLPVPFISYGGSAILSFSIAIGLVLMISKKAKL